jgi:hypothetical protein
VVARDWANSALLMGSGKCSLKYWSAAATIWIGLSQAAGAESEAAEWIWMGVKVKYSAAALGGWGWPSA